MKINWYGFVLSLVIVASAQGQSHPKLAELTSLEGFVHVGGVWVPDVRTKDTKLVFAVMDYTCYRQGGRELAGTDAFCLEIAATPVSGTIHIDTTFLKVTLWSKTLIQATSDNGDADHLPCNISEVTFNLGMKSVTSVDRKKPIANHIEPCKGMPDHVSYALYDKVEYSLFGEPK